MCFSSISKTGCLCLKSWFSQALSYIGTSSLLWVFLTTVEVAQRWRDDPVAIQAEGGTRLSWRCSNFWLCAACLTYLYFSSAALVPLHCLLYLYLSLPREEEFVHLVQRSYVWKPTTSCTAVQHLVKTFAIAKYIRASCVSGSRTVGL